MRWVGVHPKLKLLDQVGAVLSGRSRLGHPVPRALGRLTCEVAPRRLHFTHYRPICGSIQPSRIHVPSLNIPAKPPIMDVWPLYMDVSRLCIHVWSLNIHAKPLNKDVPSLCMDVSCLCIHVPSANIQAKPLNIQGKQPNGEVGRAGTAAQTNQTVRPKLRATGASRPLFATGRRGHAGRQRFSAPPVAGSGCFLLGQAARF